METIPRDDGKRAPVARREARPWSEADGSRGRGDDEAAAVDAADGEAGGAAPKAEAEASPAAAPDGSSGAPREFSPSSVPRSMGRIRIRRRVDVGEQDPVHLRFSISTTYVPTYIIVHDSVLSITRTIDKDPDLVVAVSPPSGIWRLAVGGV